ncbi:hypothetical protein XF_0650 [Xylella fastidiosa 9a5c]|uniref:Uncharacterized protein n=1 Tax=Xylella fastidiosa (strain 9a5c) TaxID=160492 RepID=Q9PFK7_XYLFA|nr:hypothetical protein XF_0650 [Xylella fastidiosa 9a5c]
MKRLTLLCFRCQRMRDRVSDGVLSAVDSQIAATSLLLP